MSDPRPDGFLPLTAPEAAAQVRAARARGFLDLDPVTQNDALLTRAMSAAGAQVFGYGDTLVGYRPNRDNPRQAVIATTSDDPAAVRGLTEFLLVRGRYTSFTATATDDQPAATALRGGGFAEVARLRGHVYRSGRYHDVSVWFADGSRPAAAGSRPAAGGSRPAAAGASAQESGTTTEEAACAP